MLETVEPGKGGAASNAEIPRLITPLWVIALFVALTETICGFAVTKTTDGVQLLLAIFVVVFPVLVAIGFFAILWLKPWQLYSPHDFTTVKVDTFVKALRGVTQQTKRIEGKLDTIQEEQRLSRQLLNVKSDELWRRQLNVAMMVHGGMVRFAYVAGKPETEEQLCAAMGKYLANASHMHLLLPKEVCDAIGAVSQSAIDLVDAFCDKGAIQKGDITRVTESIRAYERCVRRTLSLDAIDKNTGLSAAHIDSMGAA